MTRASESVTNSSSALVRGMSQSDIPAITAILAESPEASAWSEASLLEAASSGAGWAAEKEGTVVGFLVGRAISPEFEILNMAVARSHRRRGIAGHLLKDALQWASDRGGKRFFLEVRASNRPAITLYEQYGFASCGRRTRYYAHPIEDAIVMSRANL